MVILVVDVAGCSAVRVFDIADIFRPIPCEVEELHLRRGVFWREGDEVNIIRRFFLVSGWIIDWVTNDRARNTHYKSPGKSWFSAVSEKVMKARVNGEPATRKFDAAVLIVGKSLTVVGCLRSFI